ncbi:collagenase-like [Zophobas morio]|uniref:collagenase-like n=1 Tax=Zophobas morio TaxID=2755281 RepID=UPI00308381C1
MLRYTFYLCFWVLLADTSSLQNAVSPKIVFHEANDRILNGENATLGQFPWQVAILSTTNDSATWCSGSLISEDWVLTAAHCVDGAIVADVYVGGVDLDDVAALVLADEFVVHEDYDASTLANDIALVQLRTGLAFSDIIAPIALASDPLDAGVNITVSGFGQTSDDDIESIEFLHFITVTTIENTECSDIYEDVVILEEMVCASAGTDPFKSPCPGDSGAPGVINLDSDPFLVAITIFSSDTGCESGYPSGYTRVDHFRDWIQENSGV